LLVLLELLPLGERGAPLRERRILELRDQPVARCAQRVAEAGDLAHALEAVRGRQLERAAQRIDASAQIGVHASR
jgi:hypothetical protein